MATCGQGHEVFSTDIFCPDCGMGVQAVGTCRQGHEIYPTDLFCPECGVGVQEASCTNGHSLLPGQKFCPECGAAPKSTGGPPESLPAGVEGKDADPPPGQSRLEEVSSERRSLRRRVSVGASIAVLLLVAGISALTGTRVAPVSPEAGFGEDAKPYGHMADAEWPSQPNEAEEGSTGSASDPLSNDDGGDDDCEGDACAAGNGIDFFDLRADIREHLPQIAERQGLIPEPVAGVACDDGAFAVELGDSFRCDVRGEEFHFGWVQVTVVDVSPYYEWSLEDWIDEGSGV